MSVRNHTCQAEARPSLNRGQDYCATDTLVVGGRKRGKERDKSHAKRGMRGWNSICLYLSVPEMVDRQDYGSYPFKRGKDSEEELS